MQHGTAYIDFIDISLIAHRAAKLVGLNVLQLMNENTAG